MLNKLGQLLSPFLLELAKKLSDKLKAWLNKRILKQEAKERGEALKNAKTPEEVERASDDIFNNS